MSLFQYYDYNGPETVSMEYKLFTFHPRGTFLDPNDQHYAEKLLETENGNLINQLLII